MIVDPADPFNNKPPPSGGFVDEVHDGKWYQDTVKKCQEIANGEPFMVLPVIGYVDKTGTDVKACRFTSKAWRVLGFVPDLEHKSSASMTRARSGVLGKGRPSRNYHRCLAMIMKSFTRNQGLTKPMYGNIRIGNQVARR